MVASSERLQSCSIPGMPFPCDENTKTWSFSDKLSKKNAAFFRRVVKNHALIAFEYSVHCTQLAADLVRKAPDELTEQIKTALVMAELLEYLHYYYLDVPREALRLRREQDVYRQFLNLQGYTCVEEYKRHHRAPKGSKHVHDLTVDSNWPRLFLLRVRRLLLSVDQVAVGSMGYHRVIGSAEKYVGPVVPWVSIFFFVPRLFTNLFLMFKHLIPGNWMSSQERSLGLGARFNAQLERRWFELGNDAAWFSIGVINCFVLVGVLAPVALYVGVAMQAFDVIMVSVRAHLELSRIQQLEQKYERLLKDPTLDAAAREHVQGYLFHLKQRLHYEKKRHYFAIANNCVLLIAVALLVPFFAIQPVIAMIGAALAVLNTIVFFGAAKYLEAQKPKDKIHQESPSSSAIVKHGFFKAAPPPDLDVSFTPKDLPSIVLA